MQTVRLPLGLSSEQTFSTNHKRNFLYSLYYMPPANDFTTCHATIPNQIRQFKSMCTYKTEPVQHKLSNIYCNKITSNLHPNNTTHPAKSNQVPCPYTCVLSKPYSSQNLMHVSRGAFFFNNSTMVQPGLKRDERCHDWPRSDAQHILQHISIHIYIHE